MTSHDYLVEMTFTPFASLPSPQELVAFNERMVQPTFEALQRLVSEGRILAGGTALGAAAFHFIARAQSPQEFDEMLSSLPLWPRAQTRIVALGTFEARARVARDRLQNAKALVQPAATQPVEAN